MVKEHQRRRVVRRATCRCRACGGRTTPRSRPAPYPRAKVTCDWLAWLVHQKFGLLTPLDRIRRDLAERGVPLAMSTLVGLVERAADLLAPVDGHHWRTLLAGRWMATDGTGLKVLVPKLPAAHNGYLELYRNREIAVFQYEPDKAAEGVVAKLQPFRGTLTADAEHRFNAVYALRVPVQAYLTWAFERLGTHRDVYALPIDQLTPAAFQRAPLSRGCAEREIGAVAGPSSPCRVRHGAASRSSRCR